MTISSEPGSRCKQNPVLVQRMGMSSAPVSDTPVNEIGLGSAAAFATIFCCLTASLLPRLKNDTRRLLLFLLIIAGSDSLIVFLFQRHCFSICQTLGTHVPLHCAHGLLPFRTERYASHSKPIPAVKDSVVTALDFSSVLLAMASMRDWLSTETLASQSELLYFTAVNETTPHDHRIRRQQV